MKVSLCGYLLLAAVTLACSKSESNNAKAREIWMKHERVVEAAAKREQFTYDDFIDSAKFFGDFGIMIPGDHSPIIYWYPTSETAKAVEPLRQWYQANGDRLYWDSKSAKVRLRPLR